MADLEDINKFNVSLTSYDVLGYVAPGGTFLACIVFFEYCLKHLPLTLSVKTQPALHTPELTALTKAFQATSTGNWLSAALFGLAILGTSYVIGHIIASVSSFIIDRTLVFKGYGYPYSNLLEPGVETRPSHSGSFYRGLFFWVNAYLLARYLDLFIVSPGSVQKPVAHLMASSIGWLIAAAIVLKVVVSARRPRLKQPLLRYILIFLGLFGALYDAVASLLGGILNTRRSFGEDFIARYRHHFERQFSLAPLRSTTNNFWFCYCFVVEVSPNLRAIATNWHTMVSFARNLACAFYLAFLYGTFWLMVEAPKLNAWQTTESMQCVFIPLLFFVSAFLMLIRYYYLFVCRFTKFIFRAFVFLNEFKRPGAVEHLDHRG